METVYKCQRCNQRVKVFVKLTTLPVCSSKSHIKPAKMEQIAAKQRAM